MLDDYWTGLITGLIVGWWVWGLKPNLLLDFLERETVQLTCGRSKLATIEADKARLDWLEVAFANSEGTHVTRYIGRCELVGGTGKQIGFGSTVRDAIDAAMKGGK